jgi:hypothetical protein
MLTETGAPAPTVRLALSGTGQKPSHNVLSRLDHPDPLAPPRAIGHCSDLPLPSILVSHFYRHKFLEHREKYHIDGWVLDSGAFSAHQLKVEVDLLEYTELAQHLLTVDERLEEVFALDVIGDCRASQTNTEKMWEAGVPAIPCYHMGEPESVLLDMAKRYPKIALGGVALLKGGRKMKWASQCFARVWPKKIHGFGFGSRNQIMGLPWHSTDATNWECEPTRFGTWRSFDGAALGIRGKNQPLQVEVDHCLRIQRDARSRWKKEMQLLEELTDVRP